MKTISRYIMTLALLLTAVTGAWAQGTSETFATKQGQLEYTGQHVKVTATHLYDSGAIKLHSQGQQATIETLNGETINSIVVTASENPQNCTDVKTTAGNVQGGNPTTTITDINATSVILSSKYIVGISEITVYYTASDAIEVTPGSSANTWTFAMPGSDVVLTPIYAPTAMFATDGNQVLTPTAAEGIYAESTDSIITPGKVAKIGETENVQGIVMYAVTSTNEAKAPELSAFNATLPTAEKIAAGDVLVWYYIKGADAPQDQTATAENTFNDSEICTEPLKVTVLNNKFNIQFNAANDNTIEAGRATVTVGGTDKTATVTDGKLKAVKMGSEVKLEANPGYKFRKVEVKKTVVPALNITNPVVGQVIGSDGKNYAYGSLPTDVTAVAKVCYVDGNGHGLALALTDEGQMNWSTAIETCAAHTPAFTGGTWKLASKAEWSYMISAAGSYGALRDGFSSVGGTNMQSGVYFSSTEYDSYYAWLYYFNNGLWDFDSKNYSLCVRACLAF